jgi:hypothetical protein
MESLVRERGQLWSKHVRSRLWRHTYVVNEHAVDVVVVVDVVVTIGFVVVVTIAVVLAVIVV